MIKHTKGEYKREGALIWNSEGYPVCALCCETEEEAAKVLDSMNACTSIPNPEAIPKLVEALKEWKNSFANGISTRKLFAALREAGIK